VQAQGSAVYLCTYVDLMPNAASSAEALLKRYSNSSRTQPGNLQFDVLHEIARPSRFAILEAWADEAALESHEGAASMLHFRDQLEAVQSAPYDKRVGRRLYHGREASEHRAGAIYVLTHVDITPNHQDDYLRTWLSRPRRITATSATKSCSRRIPRTTLQSSKSGLQGGLYDERMYDKVD
jgi:quinol monooxygenase YgiN